MPTPSSPLSPEALALLARRSAVGEPGSAGRVSGPLSFAQLTQWFFAERYPQSTVFNVVKHVRLHGRIDAGALQRSLQSVVDRQAALRTVFASGGAEPTQRVLPPRPVNLVECDARPASAPGAAAAADRLLHDRADQAFDLASDQLLRATLVRDSDDAWRLQLVTHHIVFDGWSTGVLLDELAAGYRAAVLATAAARTPLVVQVTDAAAWLRDAAREDERHRGLEYWRDQLGDSAPVELPVDFPAPPVAQHRGARLSVNVPDDLWRAARVMAAASGSTAFALTFAAWGALVARRCGEMHTGVGVMLAGRTRAEWEPLIGNFVNVAPLVVAFDRATTFADLVAQARQRSSAAFGHQHLPFQQLTAALGRGTRAGTDAPYATIFNYRNYPARLPEALPDLVITGVESPLRGTSAALALNVLPDDDGATLELDYDPDQFSAATAARWLDGYVALLEAAVRDPDTPVLGLPLIGAIEFSQLAAWNDTDRDRDRHATLAGLYARQVATTPGAIAVSDREGEWTYRELGVHAAAIAAALRARGIGRGAFVGVCMERCLGLVAAITGILEAGAAYVPIDPGYPAQRIDTMIGDAGVTAVVTGPGTPPDLARAGRFLLPWNAAPDASGGTLNGGESTAADPAYVIFTSGSTGQPKGVVIPHSAIVNHMEWMLAELPLTEADRVLQQTSMSFDASVWEFSAPLLARARLVLAPPGVNRDPRALIDVIIGQKITEIQVVPSMLRAMLDTGRLGEARSLRRVCCGGEAMTWDLVAAFRRAHPADLVNLYGPTETAIDAAWWVADSDTGPGPVPLGRPISNVRAHVLAADNEACPIGVPGELFIAGESVGSGYLGHPALTAERFTADRFRNGAGMMYRTGDRARWRHDGQLEFLGRLDGQIKVRGFRIEPGEIEAALEAIAAVRLAAVVVERKSENDPRLIAHVELRAGATADEATLHGQLRSRLPDYMVPSRIVIADQLPRTASGKIDRVALAARPAAAPASTGEPVEWAPDSTLEYTLTLLWQRLLDVPRVSLDDDFFQLGGHSLLAARMANELMESTGHHLPLSMLFESSTIRSLMPRLLEHSFPGADAAVTAVQRGAGRTPFFMLTGDMMGGGFYCRGVAAALEPEQPFYAIAPIPATDDTRLATIAGMAARHLADVRRIQAKGPYRLGGFCVGGVIAYEMARQLRAEREDVDLLVLVDSRAPRRSGRLLDLAAELAGRLTARGEQQQLDHTGYLKARLELYHRMSLGERVAMSARYPLRLLARAVGRGNGAALDAVTVDDDPGAGSPYRRALRHHGRAQDLYHHGRYDGRIDLLRSRNAARSPAAELAGWQRVATTVVMHEAPGAHTDVVFTHLPRLLRDQLARLDPRR